MDIVNNECKTCLTCKWCILKDEGYSNYTVENTMVYCGKRMHPETPFDRGWGGPKQQPKILFAETCHGYSQGEPASFDVDGESNSCNCSDEQLQIIKDCWQDFLNEWTWLDYVRNHKFQDKTTEVYFKLTYGGE